MFIKLKLLETNSSIYKKILSSLILEVDKFFKLSANTLKKEIPPIVIKNIRNSEEYRQITSDITRLELGLIDPVSKIDGLIDIWLKNILYSYNKPKISNNTIKGNFSIKMIKTDFSDVLGSEYSKINDNLRGYKLDWLEWLLLDGTRDIVSNYEVVIGPNKRSRTGYAIMKPSDRSWSVPSSVSGTLSDNWITRAVDSSSGEIQDLLDRVFQ
jgi:hypothetical protein